jgi:hypothetical protein
MGATTFTDAQVGTTADEAFRAAVRGAQYEYGHGGYTGTIAEKSSFTFFGALPAGCSLDEVVELLLDTEACDYDREAGTFTPNAEARAAIAELERLFPGQAQRLAGAFPDKWGPAICFEDATTASERSTSDRKFYFCGWASC